MALVEGFKGKLVDKDGAPFFTEQNPGAIKNPLDEDGNVVPIAMASLPVDEASEPGGSITVGTSSSEGVAANQTRGYLSLSNPDGPGHVWIRFADTGSAEVGKGLWLPPGGYWEMPSFALIRTALQMIATFPGTSVAITEW